MPLQLKLSRFNRLFNSVLLKSDLRLHQIWWHEFIMVQWIRLIIFSVDIVEKSTSRPGLFSHCLYFGPHLNENLPIPGRIPHLHSHNLTFSQLAERSEVITSVHSVHFEAQSAHEGADCQTNYTCERLQNAKWSRLLNDRRPEAFV